MGLEGTRLGIVPQRMPGARSKVARQGNSGTEGRALLPEVAGQADSWATGGPGETQMLSLFGWFRWFPKWEEADWRGHKEEPRGPLGFTEEQSRRGE